MILIIILILFHIPYCLTEEWYIDIYTGNERFAGTDANVYIRLFNSQGRNTNEYKLTHYNWIPGNRDFPVRNLFEMGARERFHIQTTDIGSVAKIQIRHNNFPTFQADWLLDQVIVERYQDGVKYIFKCNCWLRRSHPYITLSALPDPNSIDKNKRNNSLSKNSRTFIIILVILIILVTSIFYCYNKYRRRQRHTSSSLNNTIEQTQQESSHFNTYYSQSPMPTSPSSEPQHWINRIRQWKNFQHGLSSNNQRHTNQSTVIAATSPITSIRTSTDDPPAYDDLYPNSTVPINTSSNSNV